MSFFAELKRRNVYRVALAYLVIGWLLTEVLTTILPELGAPAWSVRAVILIFAFGFIPTVIFSWVYELTPDGLKREHEVDRDDSITSRTGRKLDYITVGAVIILIVFVALFSAQNSDDAAPLGIAAISDASVAVLPFQNMSDSQENEYFSDGLTETLLHMLAQMPDLKVAARTSSFAFKNQNVPIGEIAGALQVAHVLEGSVQRVGDRVRITAQLIRAEDGFHVWSESYDRTLDDIFGIQDEIATKVGGALSESLLGRVAGSDISGVDTDNPDAYDLYLQALQERRKYSFGGLQASENLLKGALTIDPEFLDAKLELANNYQHQVETGIKHPDEAYPEIVALAEQVLQERPDDASARALRIFAESAERGQEDGPQAVFDAIASLEALLDQDPQAFAPRLLLTRFYSGQQQFDKALPLMLEVLNADPFNPRIHYELGSIYTGLERFDDARASLERSLEIEPEQPNAYATLAGLSLRDGDGLDYVQQFLKAIEVDPVDHELPGLVALFLYELDLIEEGDDFRNRVMAIAPTSPIAYQIDLVRAINVGDDDAAADVAQRAIENDIEDRRFAFGGAVQELLRIAVRRDSIDEISAYLDMHTPGLLDVDEMSTPVKYRGAQAAALDAWYVSLPREEMLARMDRLLSIARSFGFDPTENPHARVGELVLRGETDAAVEVAVNDLFPQSVAVNLAWQRNFSQAQYAEFVARPAVQEALHRWQVEEEGIRQQVRTYLSDLSASL
ncbi:MAG: tetratricopeptide repeat protein [Gammaproteobacteria bacterium]|nr:tetratricopeptide repeat protein [Gammaproteobacteria bacterium]